MTSIRKIAANRNNGRKSRGPRSQTGKQRSSRNALRHGLSAVSHRNPVFFDEVEQIAKAICGDDQNPALFTQAVVIAENELILRCVAMERVALIEKFRDPFFTSTAKRAADIPMAEIRIRQDEIAYNEYSQLMAKRESRGEGIWVLVPPRKCEPGEPAYKYEPLEDRDEYTAMQQAMPDLERLSRYERRAWSRRNRAIQLLVAIRACTERVGTRPGVSTT
jgi:hypothetical protein